MPVLSSESNGTGTKSVNTSGSCSSISFVVSFLDDGLAWNLPATYDLGWLCLLFRRRFHVLFPSLPPSLDPIVYFSFFFFSLCGRSSPQSLVLYLFGSWPLDFEARMEIGEDERRCSWRRDREAEHIPHIHLHTWYTRRSL